MWFKMLEIKCTVATTGYQCIKLLLKGLQQNIKKRFIGTKQLDIYTLTNEVVYYKKILVKQA